MVVVVNFKCNLYAVLWWSWRGVSCGVVFFEGVLFFLNFCVKNWSSLFSGSKVPSEMEYDFLPEVVDLLDLL